MGNPSEKNYYTCRPDLRELTPGYLQNRRKDIKTIDTALKDADLIKIRTLGHSMKGSGGQLRIHAHQCDWSCQ
jgi:hypothetical protein